MRTNSTSGGMFEMADVTAAVDASGLTDMLSAVENATPPLSTGGSGSLGPFTASYGATASFSGGSVALMPPNTIQVTNCTLHYSLSLSFGIDLNTVIPPLCLPQVCIPIPFDGQICTPAFCITWPVINITLPTYSDSLQFTADFSINPHLTGGVWKIDVVIISIPALNLSVTAAGLLAAIGVAVAAIVSAVPLIGPVLGVAIAAIMALISLAAVTGLLGTILTRFVSGLTFNIYNQPQKFQLLPPAAGDPAVNVTINALTAAVVAAADKSELVATADI